MIRGRLVAALGLLRVNRSFRRYALARTASVLGTTTAPAGLSFALIGEGGGATTLGVVVMASLVAFLAVTPFAGVLADRLPRLTIMVVCQIVCGVSQGISGVLVLASSATVWSLGVLAVLTAAAGAFFHPAAKGLITAIVEPDELVAANALLQIAGNVIAIIAPTVAGVAIVAMSPGWVLAWDGLTFLASAALFALLRLGAARARQERRGLFAELVEGFAAFGRRRWLWVLTCLRALTSACWGAGFTVLGPIVAVRHLEGGAISFGIIGSALGIGLVIGSTAALILAPARVGLLLCATALPEALLFAAMAAAVPIWWIAAAGVLTGAAGTLQLVCFSSAQQRELPDEQLGRVVATSAVAGSVLVPVFSAVAGPLADAVGVRTVLAGCAALVAAGAAAAFCVRDVRHLTVGGPSAAPAPERPEPAC